MAACIVAFQRGYDRCFEIIKLGHFTFSNSQDIRVKKNTNAQSANATNFVHKQDLAVKFYSSYVNMH